MYIKILLNFACFVNSFAKVFQLFEARRKTYPYIIERKRKPVVYQGKAASVKTPPVRCKMLRSEKPVSFCS